MKLLETSLTSQLRDKNVTDIYVCGIAYDVCVGELIDAYFLEIDVCVRNVIFRDLGATVTDASNAGYRTILLDDCCRGVDNDDIEKTKASVVKNHGIVINSNQVGEFTRWYVFFFGTRSRIDQTSEK